MSLERFVDRIDRSDRSLVVVNRDAPRPIQSMLEGVFESQPVAVLERELPDVEEDTVLLVEAGEVIATSTLESIQESILLINSDLYITGGVGLDSVDVPPVIDGLAETRFSLQSYPQSDTEKLLLIMISRRIERLAWSAGEGVLRASFQRLSRIDDERGTRMVYETLGDSDVATHVYGVPDWTPEPGFGVTMHGGYGPDFRDSWFVVYSPPPGSDRDPAALVAVENDDRHWEGFWTYEPALAADVNDYIERRL